MRLMRLLFGVIALSGLRELAHRANLLFQLVQAVIGTGAGLFALGVVFSHVHRLAGWRLEGALAVLGAFQVVGGLLAAFVEPNLAWFANKVTDGAVDEMLLQPVPSVFTASLGAASPWPLLQALLGLGQLLWAGGHTEGGLSPGGVMSCLFLLAAGLVIGWGLRVLMASLAFWAPGFAPDVLYGAFWQMGRYPVGIYPRPLRFVLTFLVPVAFVATLPAHALVHGGEPRILAGGLAAALVMFGVVQWVWRASLRRYTSATS